MIHEDLVTPTEEQSKRFKNLGALFGNSEDIFFLRVSALNALSGIKVGDVLIVDKKAESEGNELRIFIDRVNGRFIVTRREQPLYSYWGKVLWILKKAK